MIVRLQAQKEIRLRPIWSLALQRQSTSRYLDLYSMPGANRSEVRFTRGDDNCRRPAEANQQPERLGNRYSTSACLELCEVSAASSVSRTTPTLRALNSSRLSGATRIKQRGIEQSNTTHITLLQYWCDHHTVL